MRDKKEMALVWKHTHKDFKSKIKGERYVMYLENGGTVLGPLATMPEEEFQRKLEYAKRKEAK